MQDGNRRTDLEEIWSLKHRYARLIDTKRWDGFITLFTDDVVWDYVGLPRLTREDTLEMYQVGTAHVAGFATMLADVQTVHHIVMPEIRFTGPDTAEGVWSLHDLLFLPTNRFEGWGHYYEDYVRIGGEWKISRIIMRRLKIVEQWYDEGPTQAAA
uniref:SnoaL-like domain-containing protein n=1 Tax=Sphingomonas sp. JE1 TaxID=1628059 RepID=A0A0D4ZZQ4_9SPHN|nr:MULTISPECIES: nuclear transport factor 2 family protein [unclassified Sphingomonas]AJW29604.1 hypothetical protein pJE1_182 [Sphingomonas sp. JE1]